MKSNIGQAAELSVRVFVVAILLTLLLATANAYLALKLGILTSASIPAAIISMGILRLFKNPSILENNAVQTAASAGEAVAGGIVYTIPAMVIIGYWHHFDYLTNFFIAACGGVLGVLFSIPLRRVLVHDRSLKFPEGQAIAEVLKSSSELLGMRGILLGGLVGAFLELLQTGFQLMASSWSYFFIIKRSVFGLGAGFSAAMIGSGYLIGYRMATSIFIGAVISWLIALPVVSQFHPEFLDHKTLEQATAFLWNTQLRYFGIGAMLFAGLWTFIRLVRPLMKSIRDSYSGFTHARREVFILRTEKDIPLSYLLIGTGTVAAILFLFFQVTLPFSKLGLDNDFLPSLVFVCVIYVLFIGFLFSVITAYFSGMVGVSASPGSSVVIAGMLFAAWLLLMLVRQVLPLPLTTAQIQAAEAITIIIGSVVTGIAAIANDNTQDLKVGQLVGATPWKQQLMLLLGVLVSALIIPPIMQLLFNVYGIAGVMPHAGMDLHQSLPAPTSALMAAITEAVFRNTMPWTMMISGGVLIIVILCSNQLFNHRRAYVLSILGVAIGMYLPLATSMPLLIGGSISWLVETSLRRHDESSGALHLKKQKGILIACGLVAGAAVMDVLLAIPFSLLQNPNALSLVGEKWQWPGVLLAVLATGLLAFWILKSVNQGKSHVKSRC